jgi:hypothetical protein
MKEESGGDLIPSANPLTSPPSTLFDTLPTSVNDLEVKQRKI